MSTLRMWGNAVRAIWNKPLRKEMLRNGEFIASHLQMLIGHICFLEWVIQTILGVLWMQYEEWFCGGIFTIGHSPEPACICTQNCTPTPYDWSQHRK